MTELSPEDMTKVKTAGALGYNLHRTAMLVGGTQRYTEIIEALQDTTTEVRREYDAGVISGEFAVDQKVFERARSGDAKAIDQFYLRKIELQGE